MFYHFMTVQTSFYIYCHPCAYVFWNERTTICKIQKIGHIYYIYEILDNYHNFDIITEKTDHLTGSLQVTWIRAVSMLM